MNHFTEKTNKLKELARGHRGYALLFAVLVSAVVLGVGVSILNIARKEILLTSGAEQSQYAFYAADTGYECAVFQDVQRSAFASTSTSPGAINVSCGPTYVGSTPTLYSSPVTVTQVNPGGVGTAEYDYDFSVPVSPSGACAAVTVQKFITTTIVGTTTSTTASTSILSDGFNVGLEAVPARFPIRAHWDCNGSDPSKVERALLANY